jgi:hypothetical protein
MEKSEQFEDLVAEVLQRFLRQNGAPALSASETTGFVSRLGALIVERGLPPPPIPPDDRKPGELPEAEVTALAARVVGETSPPMLADAARQLVKACFYPEFRECRNSFRAATADGACRRQQLERALKRISGSHCVDCPHWQSLAPSAHARYLAAEWCGDVREFETHPAVFLPEDFRALRVWIRQQARGA